MPDQDDLPELAELAEEWRNALDFAEEKREELAQAAADAVAEGYTQTYVAEVAEVTRLTVSRWYNEFYPLDAMLKAARRG